MTREQIITEMCYVYRQDYGLACDPGILPNINGWGMTEIERQALWNNMAEIFDNAVAPNMEFKHR